MKTNKYNYLWIIQGFYGYGYGWEDLSAYKSIMEARKDLKQYREAESQYNHRMIFRRELNKNNNSIDL